MTLPVKKQATYIPDSHEFLGRQSRRDGTVRVHRASLHRKGWRLWLMYVAPLTLMLAMTASQVGAHGLPAAQQSHGTMYVTGGFGENMAGMFKAAQSEYALGLTFAEDAGGGSRPYVAEVSVQIQDEGGKTVLDVASAGPYLLVQLPPGSYTVDASYQGQKQSVPVKIGEGTPVQKVLTWKQP